MLFVLFVLSVCLCAIFVNFTLLFLSPPLPLVFHPSNPHCTHPHINFHTVCKKEKKKLLTQRTNLASRVFFFFSILFFPFRLQGYFSYIHIFTTTHTPCPYKKQTNKHHHQQEYHIGSTEPIQLDIIIHF